MSEWNMNRSASNSTQQKSLDVKLPVAFWWMFVIQIGLFATVLGVAVYIPHSIENAGGSAESRLMLENDKLTGSINSLKAELGEVNDQLKKINSRIP